MKTMCRLFLSVLFIATVSFSQGYDSIHLVTNLRIINDIAGWIERQDSYIFYDVDGLYGLINGATETHAENGLIEGICQILEDSSNKRVNVFSEDFGTTENASAMFEQIRSEVAQQNNYEITGYDTMTAFARMHLTGVVAYAHFDRFFFWLTFTGYDEPEIALNDALIFINLLSEKVDELLLTEIRSKIVFNNHYSSSLTNSKMKKTLLRTYIASNRKYLMMYDYLGRNCVSKLNMLHNANIPVLVKENSNSNIGITQ
jgi:hypothetical protein